MSRGQHRLGTLRTLPAVVCHSQGRRKPCPYKTTVELNVNVHSRNQSRLLRRRPVHELAALPDMVLRRTRGRIAVSPSIVTLGPEHCQEGGLILLMTSNDANRLAERAGNRVSHAIFPKRSTEGLVGCFAEEAPPEIAAAEGFLDLDALSGRLHCKAFWNKGWLFDPRSGVDEVWD